jgi:hypothetical protein
MGPSVFIKSILSFEWVSCVLINSSKMSVRDTKCPYRMRFSVCSGKVVLRNQVWLKKEYPRITRKDANGKE